MSQDHPVFVRAYERAKKVHKEKNPPKPASSWGFLNIFSSSEEPSSAELSEAFEHELRTLSVNQLLALPPPAATDRRAVFADVLTRVALERLASCGLEDADELYDRCNAAHVACAASLGSVPEHMVDHAKLLVGWMKWRFEKQFLHDSVLFYLVQAEYQLFEAITPGLLTKPSDETVREANDLLEDISVLKKTVIDASSKDMKFLADQIAKHGARIEALKAKEEKLKASQKAPTAGI